MLLHASLEKQFTCVGLTGVAGAGRLRWRALRQLSLQARHEEALQGLHAPLQLPVLVGLYLHGLRGW